MKSLSYYESLIQELIALQREVANGFSDDERMAIQNAIGQIILLAKKQLDELKNEN